MVKTQTQTQTQSARELHALAVQRAAEHGERVAAAAAQVQQAAALLAALDRQQQVADNAVAAAKAAVEAARRDLLDAQAGAVIAAGASGEAEAVAAVQAAQERFDATVRNLSEAQATQMDTRAELDGQRDQLQDQHASAKAAHSDLEQLQAALVEHVAHAKDAAGREAAAEILSERAALRKRITAARAELESAYASMFDLSASVSERMADHPAHLVDVRGPNDERGPFPSWLEPRRELAETFSAYLAAMVRCNGHAGTAAYVGMQMNLPEREVMNAFMMGNHKPNLFISQRREIADVLAGLARVSGEE